MTTLDGNDYRKRVLAAIVDRGGAQTSDPFEYYDLPMVEMRDSVVADQIDAVWAFWQKQRDSPKYRGLIVALLEAHQENAPLMLDRDTRRELAERVRHFRTDRDTTRFAELDAAVERLVERFGGVPQDKVEGLRRFAVQAGLDATGVDARLSRLPVLQSRAAPPTPALPEPVRRQVRTDLDELGQLLGSPPPVTLYDLLGLTPDASPEEVVRARDAAAARNRELRPDRRRALVDDLLAAVTRLLLDGDSAAYLDAVAEDVTARLRPRVTAAVLVEDTLTPDDFSHLVSEAEAAGLDRHRAWTVLAVLAREAGVTVPETRSQRTTSTRTPTGTDAPTPARRSGRISYERPSASPAPPPSGRQGPDNAARSRDLSAARAALRAGRALEAQRLVEKARRHAGEVLPPLRAVADEVTGVLDEARQQWRAIEQALTARRFHEAAVALDRLAHIAADTTGPSGMTVQSAFERARDGLQAADALLVQAERLAGAEREAALMEALRQFPDAEGLRLAVQALPVLPASDVRATASSGGVLVRWRASPTSGEVDYRVLRVGADGSRRPLATTRGLELEDGLAPQSGAAVPTYVVIARRTGVLSDEATSAPLAPVTLAPVTLAPVTLAPVTLAPDARAGRPLPHRKAVDLPPVGRLRTAGDRALWDWPPGCTEALLVWREDAPPTSADDPQAQRRKVTNTKYEIDGGAPLPAGPLHLAVFPCTRDGGELVAAPEAPAGARLSPAPSPAGAGEPERT